MYFFIPELKTGRVGRPHSDHMFSMRVEIGKNYHVSNQQGIVAEVVINTIDKKNKVVEYSIIGTHEYENIREGVLYQALIDRKYQEKLLEVLPFTTFAELVFVSCDQSSPQQPQYDRLESILQRSCSQCQTPWKPTISRSVLAFDSLPFSDLIVLDSTHSKQGGTNSVSKNTCFVGPEGGWSKAEQDFFVEESVNTIFYPGVVYPAWISGLMFNSRKV